MYCWNILDFINLNVEKFDFVGINYVFYCVLGNFKMKLVVFDDFKVLMNFNVVFFGLIIL